MLLWHVHHLDLKCHNLKERYDGEFIRIQRKTPAVLMESGCKLCYYLMLDDIDVSLLGNLQRAKDGLLKVHV